VDPSTPIPKRSGSQLDEALVSELFRHAVDDSQEFVRTEIELAKQEARSEAKFVLTAIVVSSIAIALAVTGVMGLVSVLVLAADATPKAALSIVTVLSVVFAGTGAIIARNMLPKRPLPRTEGSVRRGTTDPKGRFV
jgi:uncharacterized membrane protein YqjE